MNGVLRKTMPVVNWSHPLNNGLVAWYLPRATGHPSMYGGLRLTDIARNRHGTLLNTSAGVWNAQSHIGGWGSLDLDGSDDTSRATHTSTMPLTLSAWFKPDTVSGSQTMVYVGNGAASFGWCAIYLSGSTPRCYYSSDADQNVFASGTVTITTSAWWHVCGVFTSAADRSVFTNGGDKANVTTSVAGATMNRLSVGIIDRSGPVFPFNGKISDVRVWNRALTDGEVAQYYQLSRCGYRGLLGRTRLRMNSAGAAPAGNTPLVYHHHHQLSNAA